MTTFFATPNNAASTTPGYAAGSGSIALAAGSGALFGAAFPLVVSTFFADGTPRGVYSASGRSGDSLTGLALLSGTDASLPAGSLVEVRWAHEHAAQHATAVNALESGLAAHVADVGNPHAVTAAQVGAYGTAAVDAMLAAKAVDAAVVHLSGAEAIAGVKTFSSTIAGSISGNAGTVTAGVYTTGSYADPAWITSLAGAKVSGDISGSAAGLTAPIAEGQVTGLTTDLAAKAPLASPALTGVPTAPTAAVGTNTTQVATTAFVLANAGSGGGSVTTVSVSSANGFTGSVATATSTPAISIGTSVAGILKGNGAAVSAAVAGADYLTPTGSGAGLTGIDGGSIATGLISTARLGSGTPSIASYLRGDGAWWTVVTNVSVASANGFGGSVASPASNPAITITTSVVGLLKGDGTGASAATAGTDYLAPTGSGAGLTALTAANISAGTAGISITGNAATVTAGVYTTGAYNDPAWITGLSGSKIVGSIPGSAAGLTAPIAESQVTGLTTDLAAKAPLASPALTGVPTAPTAATGTNTTQVATTAFVLANATGGGGGGSSNLYTQVGAGPSNGGTTLTSLCYDVGALGSRTLAANYLTTGKAIRLTIGGYITPAGVAVTPTLKVLLGGAVIGDTSATGFTAATTQANFAAHDWWISLVLTHQGSGVIAASGVVLRQGTGGCMPLPIGTAASPVTLTVSGTLQFDVQGAFSASNAGQAMVMTQCFIEALN